MLQLVVVEPFVVCIRFFTNITFERFLVVVCQLVAGHARDGVGAETTNVAQKWPLVGVLETNVFLQRLLVKRSIVTPVTMKLHLFF